MRRLLSLAVVLLALMPLAHGAQAVVLQPVHSDPSDGSVLRVSGAPLQVLSLAPGRSGSGMLTVRNESRYPARVRLVASNVRESENSCERPEQRDPSEGCGADRGELGRWLVVTVARESNGARQTLWSGRLDQLRQGANLTTSLAARGSWPLRVTVALPWEAGNDTMTDSVTFDLRVDAACELGSFHADGPRVSVGGGGSTHSSSVLEDLSDWWRSLTGR